MPKPTLKELYLAHTGKVSNKWEAYFGVYQRVFEPYREQPVALLEIGVQNGGSLELWARHFEAATILIGCDIDQRCAALQFEDQRIDVVAADANSDAAYREILSLSPVYDIIIDDGSHRSADIIASLLRYFPLLRPGGIYVIEDLHAAYLKKYGGGLREPRSAMAFLKTLADLINAEFWKDETADTEPLAGFLAAEAQPPFLRDGSVESIEFSNSLAVVRRSLVPHGLGNAVIVGHDAPIEPEWIQVRAALEAGRTGRPY